MASHTNEEQRRNAPGSAAKNGILVFLPPLCLASRDHLAWADGESLSRMLEYRRSESACPKPEGSNDSKSANVPFALQQGKGVVRFRM